MCMRELHDKKLKVHMVCLFAQPCGKCNSKWPWNNSITKQHVVHP